MEEVFVNACGFGESPEFDQLCELTFTDKDGKTFGLNPALISDIQLGAALSITFKTNTALSTIYDRFSATYADSQGHPYNFLNVVAVFVNYHGELIGFEGEVKARGQVETKLAGSLKTKLVLFKKSTDWTIISKARMEPISYFI